MDALVHPSSGTNTSCTRLQPVRFVLQHSNLPGPIDIAALPQILAARTHNAPLGRNLWQRSLHTVSPNACLGPVNDLTTTRKLGYTIPQAAEVTAIGESTLKAAIERGDLPRRVGSDSSLE